MWNKVKSFLFEEFGAKKTAAHSQDELQIAAAALLVEAALLDGDFNENEKSLVIKNCKNHFNLTTEAAESLVEEAINYQKEAVDIYSFISKFAPNFDHDERLKLIEMLWHVAYADGHLHDYEANLIRRVCGMLGVKDQESGNLRKKILEAEKNIS